MPLPRHERVASPSWRGARVLWILLAAGAVHILDDYVVQSPAGTESPVGRGLFLIGLGGLVALVAPRTWAGPRALLLAVSGSVLGADGGSHVLHMAGRGLSPTDVTGTVAAAAGAGLLGLALVSAFRRDRPASSALLRWVDRVVTLLLVGLVGVGVLVPIAVGTVQVHQPRRDVAGPPGAGFDRLTLETEDGVELRAWYRPSRNGAAVIVVNSSRGDHAASSGHARLLADNGYGVLVYDARGSGGSEGAPNGWGWTWPEDVEAGIDFLAGRADVVDDEIGLLGLSTGADVAIEVAAVDHRVRTVVADGATAQGFADRPPGLLTAVSLWPMYATAQVLTGDRPGPALEQAIARLSPRPVLLVAAGSIPQEIELNERYAAAGGVTVTLWTLPAADHTAALRTLPDEYERRVIGHLDRALLTQPFRRHVR